MAETETKKRTGLGALADAGDADDFSVIDAIGGPRGVVESMLPGVVFVVMFVITSDLHLTIGVSAALAVLQVIVRLCQRQSVMGAVSGLLAVGICLIWAWNSHEARNYYMFGFLTNAFYIVLLAISLMVRVPGLGLVIEFIRTLPTEHLRAWLADWRGDKALNRAYTIITALWIGVFSLRLVADVKGEQHFTQPPAHFTEASLVKQLEELGIGRPSTYAPTITTIIARHYVAKENKNLYVTELGEAVNNIMKKAFPTIVDVNFTANMETLLDSVGEGKVKWKEVIRNFYPDLDEAVKLAEKELENVKIEDEVTDVICDKCGRNMVIKYGPHGKFLGCPGFPECHNTKPYLEKIGVTCPKCGNQ